ncbi:WYL domain-containing protein [Candidatus Methylospira mobilis]|nr:WYL domain-containing protein [Candidatus Methylospira mobilis]
MDMLSQAQRERLAYIEFQLYFLGKVGRGELMGRFGVAPAGATRDFALYKKFAPGNIVFDNASKIYVLGERFEPLFTHSPERVLTALSQGFGDGVNPVVGPLISCEMPMVLNRLQLTSLAPITRAINLNKAVKIRYFSGSGASEREIVPFSLATDGLRWHTRAFDRKRQKFVDFVISRIDYAVVIDNSVPEKHELPEQDIQWNRIVELDLVPHPDNECPELVARDFEIHDGVLRINLRAAMAGYVLLQWHVDCSPNHSKGEDKAFRLWLRDPLALYGVESALFAPGYQPPNKINSH